MANKYNARKVEVDGYKFDSLKEAAHYTSYLRPLLNAGVITELQIHPRYDLRVNGEELRYCKSNRKINYTPDFEYLENGERKVIDVKGMDTRVSKIKRALFRVSEGVEVQVVR